MTQVVYNEGEISFFRFDTFDSGYALNSSGFGDVATKPVNCVSWVNDDSAIPQYIDNFPDFSRVGVFGVKLEMTNLPELSQYATCGETK